MYRQSCTKTIEAEGYEVKDSSMKGLLLTFLTFHILTFFSSYLFGQLIKEKFIDPDTIA